jgi:hypothetical protein
MAMSNEPWPLFKIYIDGEFVMNSEHPVADLKELQRQRGDIFDVVWPEDDKAGTLSKNIIHAFTME